MATARCFEDLIAWQLSEALKEEVFRLTERDPVWHDKKFCEQIQESARSAPANIAEGFGRYDPKPNAYHVSIAKASLEETRNHIYDGFKRNHFDVEERDNLLNLNKRALVATRRFLRYLKSCKKAPEGKPYEPRSTNTKSSAQPPHPEPRNQKLQNQNQTNQNQRNRNLRNRNLKNPKNQNPKNPKNQNPKNQKNPKTRGPS